MIKGNIPYFYTMYVFRLLYFLGCIAVVFSCNSPQAENQLVEAEFPVDSTHLQASWHTDSTLNFKLHPPRYWQSIPDSLKNSLSRQLSAGGLTFKAGYMADEQQGMLLITDMRKFSSSKLKELKADPAKAASGNWIHAEHSQFLHNQFLVDQFVLQSKELVNLKLIISRQDRQQPYFSLDFFIPAQQTETVLPVVSSSLATLTDFSITL